MYATYVSLVFSVWVFISIQTVCKGGDEKRILVNDPDVTNARISQLEHQLQQFTELTSKMSTKISTLEKQIQQKQQGQGSTYIRWGRKQCKDSQSELVYSGYTAGQFYSHASYSTRYGGPANALCLHNNPELSNTSYTRTESLIFGSEYEVNTFASNSQDEDVPCAMCRNPNTTSTVMIPGRQTCQPGWHSEYSGFIASGHQAFTASVYICVDRDPEYISSGLRNDDGYLLYQTNIQCGSLPCPPYMGNRKLPCVVCSK